MQLHLFDDWLRESFFAIVAVIVSSATFFVGFNQWRLAQQKLRLDLYNRRWEIVNSVYDFYPAMISWDGSDEQKAIRFKFFKATKEAPWLFHPASGVPQAMKRLDDMAVKVIGFKENSEKYKSDPKFLLTQFNEASDIMMKGFEAEMATIRAGAAPYLSFHKI